MQRRDDSALRVMVVDYQRCAFAPENLKDEHFLSPKVITFLSTNKYDFFIGHTFRCIINIDALRDLALQAVPPSEQHKFLSNFPTAVITQHLIERTQINCLAVSTLDDMVTGQVGHGYLDLVNYEMTGVITPNKHVEQDQQFELMKQNNRQLLLIAQDIAAKYPGRTILLDVLDDDLKHCQDALSADKQEKWPKNVCLNRVYRYSTKILRDEVTEVKLNDQLKLNTAHSARLFKRSGMQKLPVPKRQVFEHTTVMQVDSAHSTSVLVAGTYGTYARPDMPASTASAAAAATPMEPRRSDRLSSKSRVHY